MKKVFILIIANLFYGCCKDDVTTIPWTQETYEMSRLLNVGKIGSFWVYEDSTTGQLDTVYFENSEKKNQISSDKSKNPFCRHTIYGGVKVEYLTSFYKSSNRNIISYCAPTVYDMKINPISEGGYINGYYLSDFKQTTQSTPYKIFNEAYLVSYSGYNFYFVKDTGLVAFNSKYGGNHKIYKLKSISL